MQVAVLTVSKRNTTFSNLLNVYKNTSESQLDGRRFFYRLIRRKVPMQICLHAYRARWGGSGAL